MVSTAGSKNRRRRQVEEELRAGRGLGEILVIGDAPGRRRGAGDEGDGDRHRPLADADRGDAHRAAFGAVEDHVAGEGRGGDGRGEGGAAAALPAAQFEREELLEAGADPVGLCGRLYRHRADVFEAAHLAGEPAAPA